MSDVTIYTIAKKLNLSPSMVSRAFNPNAHVKEDKRRLILETAHKMGFSPNKMASRLSGKTINISIVINSHFAENTEKSLAGFKKAFENFKDYKVNYTIDMLTDESDPRKLVMDKVSSDGIILSGFSQKKFAPIINEFYAKNPNVCLLQAINENADYLFASKHSEKTASGISADFLYNCLKNQKKNVLLFTGSLESALHRTAKNEFLKIAQSYGLNVVDVIDTHDNEGYFEGIIADVFQKHTDVQGIYITSGISLPLLRYVEKNNLSPHLVTFDTHSYIKEYMDKNLISATVFQNFEGQAEKAFSCLANYVINGDKPDKTVFTPVQLVFKNNFYQFN